MENLKQKLSKYRNPTLINGTIYYNVPENVLDNLENDKWEHFTDKKYPENDCDIVVFSNKKHKYYIEHTDSEFWERCINRNYIKWMKL
jgi:hypothetical protein